MVCGFTGEDPPRSHGRGVPSVSWGTRWASPLRSFVQTLDRLADALDHFVHVPGSRRNRMGVGELAVVSHVDERPGFDPEAAWAPASPNADVVPCSLEIMREEERQSEATLDQPTAHLPVDLIRESTAHRAAIIGREEPVEGIVIQPEGAALLDGEHGSRGGLVADGAERWKRLAASPVTEQAAPAVTHAFR